MEKFSKELLYIQVELGMLAIFIIFNRVDMELLLQQTEKNILENGKMVKIMGVAQKNGAMEEGMLDSLKKINYMDEAPYFILMEKSMMEIF